MSKMTIYLVRPRSSDCIVPNAENPVENKPAAVPPREELMVSSPPSAISGSHGPRALLMESRGMVAPSESVQLTSWASKDASEFSLLGELSSVMVVSETLLDASRLTRVRSGSSVIPEAPDVCYNNHKYSN